MMGAWMQPVSLIQLGPALASSLSGKGLQVRLHSTVKPDQYFVSQYSLQSLMVRKVPFKKIRTFQAAQLPVKIVYPFQSFLFDPPNEDAQTEVAAFGMSRFPNNKVVQVRYLGRFQEPGKEGFVLDRPGGKRSYHWAIQSPPKKIREMKDQFRKIVKRIQDPETKVILSFGSGGVRFFAHPSLMKFIDILELGPYVKEVWGSSGGAIAGILYSMGIEPAVIEQEGYNLYNERYSFRFSPSKLDVLKNLLTEGLLQSSDHLLKGFLDCQNAMRTMLHKYLVRRKRKIPFYCIAYNLKQRRNEVLTPEKIKANIYTTPIFTTDALDAVIASSSIPILYVPKKILRGKSEHVYVDGGTTEELPLLTPYRKWIRDRLHMTEPTKKLLIIAVNLFPQVGSIKLLNHWLFRKVPLLRLLRLSATYADLIRQARIDEHKGHLSRDPAVTLWELSLGLKGANILDAKKIPEIIETAQHSFLRQLMEIEAHL